MTVFESLLIAHILGDWIFQTEWQAMNKATNWRAMSSHIVIYHTIVLVVLGVRLGFGYPSLYTVVAALAVLHTILDRRHPMLWFMRAMRITTTREPERWFTIALDQSIHLLFLGLVASVLSR